MLMQVWLELLQCEFVQTKKRVQSCYVFYQKRGGGLGGWGDYVFWLFCFVL